MKKIIFLILFSFTLSSCDFNNQSDNTFSRNKECFNYLEKFTEYYDFYQEEKIVEIFFSPTEQSCFVKTFRYWINNKIYVYSVINMFTLENKWEFIIDIEEDNSSQRFELVNELISELKWENIKK